MYYLTHNELVQFTKAPNEEIASAIEVFVYMLRDREIMMEKYFKFTITCSPSYLKIAFLPEHVKLAQVIKNMHNKQYLEMLEDDSPALKWFLYLMLNHPNKCYFECDLIPIITLRSLNSASFDLDFKHFISKSFTDSFDKFFKGVDLSDFRYYNREILEASIELYLEGKRGTHCVLTSKDLDRYSILMLNLLARDSWFIICGPPGFLNWRNMAMAFVFKLGLIVFNANVPNIFIAYREGCRPVDAYKSKRGESLRTIIRSIMITFLTSHPNEKENDISYIHHYEISNKAIDNMFKNASQPNICFFSSNIEIIRDKLCDLEIKFK